MALLFTDPTQEYSVPIPGTDIRLISYRDAIHASDPVLIAAPSYHKGKTPHSLHLEAVLAEDWDRQGAIAEQWLNANGWHFEPKLYRYNPSIPGGVSEIDGWVLGEKPSDAPQTSYVDWWELGKDALGTLATVGQTFFGLGVTTTSGMLDIPGSEYKLKKSGLNFEDGVDGWTIYFGPMKNFDWDKYRAAEQILQGLGWRLEPAAKVFTNNLPSGYSTHGRWISPAVSASGTAIQPGGLPTITTPQAPEKRSYLPYILGVAAAGMVAVGGGVTVIAAIYLFKPKKRRRRRR